MVNVHALGFSYRIGGKTLPVLSDVSASFEDGEITAIIGPSGCGKTTLLRLIAGLSSPSSGSIFLDDQRVDGIQAGTSIIFQDYGLLPWETVRSNAELGLKIRRVPDRERRDRVDPILDELGLRGFSSLFPLRLSGGMRQKVAVARALAQNSGILLLDEPFSSLDAMTRESLQDSLLDIHRRHGTTMILVTHSIEEAAYLADKVYILKGKNPGTIVDCVDTARRRSLGAREKGVAAKAPPESFPQATANDDPEFGYRLSPEYQSDVTFLRKKLFAQGGADSKAGGKSLDLAVHAAPADEAKAGRFSVNSPLGRMLRITATLVVLILAWWGLSLAVRKPFLPSPAAAFLRVFQNMGNGHLLHHTAVSLRRILEALLAAGPLAWALGLAAGRSKLLDAFLSPFMYIFHPIPKVAFLPILLLFLGLGDRSKLALIGLVIFGQLYVGARDSSKTLPSALFDTVRSIGGGAWSTARYIILPGNLPSLLTSLRVSLGTSIAVLFLAETFASTDGLGWYIMDAWARVDYPDMYAAMICLSVVGLLLFLLLDSIEALACRWRDNS